jgi:CheY-like chemotaxis protein
MPSAEAPLTVLHVDDDPSLASLVKVYLERDESDIDCSVRTETDPSEALDRIRSEPIDVDEATD